MPNPTPWYVVTDIDSSTIYDDDDVVVQTGTKDEQEAFEDIAYAANFPPTPAAPTIDDFTNAIHGHQDSPGGGQLDGSLAILPDTLSDSVLVEMGANTVKANPTGATTNPTNFAINTDSLFGRAGSNITNIACTAAGRALIDDADATAQRTTLAAVGRAGSEAMTGFWNIGANKLGVNTTSITGNLNIAVSGATTPGIFFSIGGSTSEEIINTISGGFGWVFSLDNSADGDFRLKTNTAKTQRYRFYRDSNRFHIGSSVISPLSSEALTIEGLVRATKGASFNTAGGSTDPDNYFKIHKSDGSLAAFFINPDITTGGVGFFTTVLTGVLNFTSGLASASKPGIAIVLQSAADNLTEWYSNVAYGSGAYGFGWLSENSATGDRVFFAKNGSSTNSTVFYAKRSNQFVGVGDSFAIGGSAPSYQLDVKNDIRASRSLLLGGDLGAGLASHLTLTKTIAAVSGATPATLGNTGGGPTGAAQSGWLKVYDGTTAKYIAVWT